MTWEKIRFSDEEGLASVANATSQTEKKGCLLRRCAAIRDWASANFSAAEVSGAVGDLGSFLPLLIALVQKVGLDLGTTLIITGLYNIITGVQFGIPICVQPMKTIAAVAISSSISLNQVLLAGMFVSVCVLVLGITRLTDLVNWLVPRSVVRGLQLAVGVGLAAKGLNMVLKTTSPSGTVVWRPWLGPDPLLLAVVALPMALFLSIDAFNSTGGDGDSASGWWAERPRDTPFEPIFRLISGWMLIARGHAGGRAFPPQGGADATLRPGPPVSSFTDGAGGGDVGAQNSHIVTLEKGPPSSIAIGGGGPLTGDSAATAEHPPVALWLFPSNVPVRLLASSVAANNDNNNPANHPTVSAAPATIVASDAFMERSPAAAAAAASSRKDDEVSEPLLGVASSRGKGRTASKGSGVRLGLTNAISASIRRIAGTRRGSREGGAGTLGAPSDSEGLLCFGSENGSKAVSGVNNKEEEGEAACAAADARPCGDGVCVYGSSASAADRSTVLSKIPHALLFVVLGLVMAAVNDPGALRSLKLGPSVPKLLRPTAVDFRRAVFEAGLPQLPLTLLNSVLAVSYLATSLFPEKDSNRWRPSVVAVCVGSMNLVGCWLGTMPCCHGSGGLAAQYKFGARSGLAPVMLGAAKVLLGLLFGGSMFTLLKAFPQTLLGSMLVVAGVELASSIKGQRGSRDWTVLLLTAVAVLALQDTGLGFCLGLAVGLVAAAKTALTRALLAAPTRREAAAAQSKEKHTITYQEMP